MVPTSSDLASAPGRRKRVTATDVARSLGLSRATVGFVLNETPGQTIPEETRRRVLDEADRLGYRPHQAARALARGGSRLVLVVLPGWPLGESMQRSLDEASAVLDRAGYSLVTITPHLGGQARPLWLTLEPEVVFAFAPVTEEHYRSIRSTGAAMLIPGRGAAAEQLLGADFAGGPRLQVEHLVARGCRRIAFAGSPDDRLAGLVAQRGELAAQAAGVATGVMWAGGEELDAVSADAVVRRWHASGVDGVVAYNDEVAALVVGAALRAGIAVPEEFAVIGHDDSVLAGLFVPSLSTVRVDVAGLGRTIAELALGAVAGASEPVNPPIAVVQLVARESA